MGAKKKKKKNNRTSSSNKNKPDSLTITLQPNKDWARGQQSHSLGSARLKFTIILLGIGLFLAGVVIGSVWLVPASQAQDSNAVVAGPPRDIEVPDSAKPHPQWLFSAWLKTLANELPDIFHNMAVILVGVAVFVIFLYGLWSIFRGLLKKL